MELNGRQRQQFQQALLSAFPSKAKLAQMLSFELDWELDAIAGGQNQSDIIFNLINYAKANGQLSKLLTAAKNDNPGNPALHNFTQQLNHPSNLPPTPETSASSSGNTFTQTNAGGVNFQNNITGGQINQAQTINLYNSPQPTPAPNNLPHSSTSPTAASKTAIKVFVSYSHKDESLREELDDHLSPLKREGKINVWNDRAIDAGEEWKSAIEQNLRDAQIILLLISAKFIASDFCHDKELTTAMARHTAGTARVIPIILKPCTWKNAPFSKLQVLPKDGKAITTWGNQDEAFVNVVQGLRRAIDSISS